MDAYDIFRTLDFLWWEDCFLSCLMVSVECSQKLPSLTVTISNSFSSQVCIHQSEKSEKSLNYPTYDNRRAYGQKDTHLEISIN